MHRIVTLLVALFGMTAVAQAADISQGRVFHDTNANGVFDEGEPPIAGVMVSNGRDLARTDADGRYSVEIDDDDFIFVIKPRGYRTPIDELGLPRYYHRHNPAGTPDDNFMYDGVEPTGALPASIDFPLQEQAELPGFDVVLLGDTQPNSFWQLDWMFEDTLPDLLRATLDTDEPPAFVISLGDLVGDALELFDPQNRALAHLGIPIYNVLGNHDQNFMSPDEDHSDETFERVFGPTTYAFQYADVHFVILDNVLWEGFNGLGDNGKPKNNNYIGGIDRDDLAFVLGYLDAIPKDELVVLCMHIPLDGHSAYIKTREKDQLLEALSSHARALTISGHSHIQRNWFFGSDDGYNPAGPNQFGNELHHHFNAGTVSGTWYMGATDEWGIPHTTMRDGSPNGFYIASFDGDEYSIRYRPSRYPESFQMSIYSPKVVDAGDTSEVVVNVFAGGPLSKVGMRIGTMTAGGREWTTWQRLEQSVRPDPFFEDVVAREKKHGTPDRHPISGVTDSHHIWVGSLPADLTPGVHMIEIKSIDMYKRTDIGRRIFRVVE